MSSKDIVRGMQAVYSYDAQLKEPGTGNLAEATVRLFQEASASDSKDDFERGFELGVELIALSNKAAQ